MSHPILTEAAARMKKAVDHTLHEFSAIHTGKATPAMIESVTVEAYGSMVPLKQCAAISTPDARLIQIQPWDISLVKAITKGIIDANLGFNPIPDGKTIRVPLPEMSRERRRSSSRTPTASPKKAASTSATFAATPSSRAKRPSCRRTNRSGWRRTSRRPPTRRSPTSTATSPTRRRIC